MASTPTSIGKYKILGVLGKGAMGLVYRGEDPLLGRQVAIKVISGDDVTDEMKERFRVEARAAAALAHPNIVIIYELGEEAEMLYIVMEVLVGEDLRALSRRRPNMSPTEICEIVAQVCEGLAYAHEQRIIHRDIKPANIQILPDGRVKVLDFGVAKMQSTSLTATGMVIGTPDYMSPEQIQGKSVDTRSDIFSVGVVMYELLAGYKPFSSESITSVIYNIVFKEPESFSSLSREVPAEVDRIVRKAMAKELEDRYQRIGDMAADLRRFLAGRVREEPLPLASSGAANDQTRVLTPQEMPGSKSGTLKSGTLQVGESPAQRSGAGAGVGGGTQALGSATGSGAGTSVVEAPRRRGLLAGVGVATMVVVYGVLAVIFGWPPFGGEEREPERPRIAVPVEILVVPWGEIESLTGPAGEKPPVLTERRTPVRIALLPGRYRATVSHPLLGLDSFDVDVPVDAAGSQRVTHVLAGFDAEAALKDLLK